MSIQLLKAQIMKVTWYLMDKKLHAARAALLEAMEIVGVINRVNGGDIAPNKLHNGNEKGGNDNQSHQLFHTPVLSAEEMRIFKDFLLPQIMCLLAIAYGKAPVSRDEGTIYHEFTVYMKELHNIKLEYVKAKALRDAEKIHQLESLLLSSQVYQILPDSHIFDAIDARLLTLIDTIELSIRSELNSAKNFLCVIKLKLLQLLDENVSYKLQFSRDIAWNIAQLYKKLADVINGHELRDNYLSVNAAKKEENKALVTLLQNSALEYESIFHQRASIVWIDFFKSTPDVNSRAQIYINAVNEISLSYQIMQNNYLTLLRTMCEVSELAAFLNIPDVKSDGGLLCKDLIKHFMVFLNILDHLNIRLHLALRTEPEKLEYFKACLYSLHDSQNKVRLKVEELEAKMKKTSGRAPIEQQQAVNQVVTPQQKNESLEIAAELPVELPELLGIDVLIKEIDSPRSSILDTSVLADLSTPESHVDIESLSPGGSSDTVELEKNSFPTSLPVPTIDSTVTDVQSVEYWKKSNPRTNLAASLAPSNTDDKDNLEDFGLSSWLTYVEDKELRGNKENIVSQPNTPVSSPTKAQVSGLIRHGIHSPTKRNKADGQRDDYAKKQKNTQTGVEAKREALHELTAPTVINNNGCFI